MQLLKKNSILLIIMLYSFASYSQDADETNRSNHQDTLRGSYGLGRMKWNVLYYDITVIPDFNAKRISGKNTITFFDSGTNTIQIDLQQPMEMDSIIEDQQQCFFQREVDVYWVKTIKVIKA